jgi:hypothetical protein
MALARRGSGGGDSPLAMQTVARQAGLHPDLVLRLIRLGAIEPAGGTRAAPLYPGDSPARLARAARRRRDLGVGWSGAILALDLLARIDELEARLRRYER